MLKSKINKKFKAHDVQTFMYGVTIGTFSVRICNSSTS